MRCPLESFLSRHFVVQVIAAADKFLLACYSDVSDDNEISDMICPAPL
jgi:hypothetical protein